MPPASTFDPDLSQAIGDLRVVAARLRAAQAAVACLPSTATLKQTAAAKQEVDELRSRIRLRADRLALNPDALLLILNETNALRGRRRSPDGDRLRVAVGRIVEDATQHELEMHARLTRVQTDAAAATRARLAADNAFAALAGVATHG